MRIKVLLLDDHKLVLQGLKQLLDHDTNIELVKLLSNPKQLFSEIINMKPDVVVIDIKIKSDNGIDLTKKIIESFPNIKVVVLSGYDNDEYIKAAYDAGASAFVTKERTNDELITAIKQSYLGYSVFPDFHSSKVNKILTSKEHEILELVSEDRTTSEIGEILMISKRTVERHISSIIGKLDADSRVGAVVNAIKQGILNVY